MKANETLEREHRWIGWMANCLEKLVSEALSTNQLGEMAAELLVLYDSFADGRHQEKEEGVLFPELLAVADADSLRVLEQLVADHGVEREHMNRMRNNLHGALYGEPLSVREFARASREYMSLHRAHMQRENEILLPMVRLFLTPDADERVAAGFEALEGGVGDPHGLEEQVLNLCRRVGLTTPPAA